MATALEQSAVSPDLVFDEAFLRKLEQLEIVARKVFRGLLRGERTTARRGRGLEFFDYRHYWPGDDFRDIDWNIYSRLDQLFLKLRASEEDVTLHLVLDASASMAFGEPRKFDHARRLVAALAYIALGNLDRVGINAFADGLVAGLPTVKARHQLARLLGFLRELPCAGPTHFAPAMRELAARLRSPGFIILVSDLLAAAQAQEGIEVLCRGGHDIVVIQLLAEAEIDPPLEDMLTLVDAESGEALDLAVDADLRRRYRQRLNEGLADMERFCRRAGVEYLRASTAIAFEDVVLKYLRQGAHLQ